MIDEAMITQVKPENAVNAAQHVWNYLEDSSDLNAKLSFEKNISKVILGESTNPIKHLLWKLAVAKQQQYLMDSLYFMKLF